MSSADDYHTPPDNVEAAYFVWLRYGWPEPEPRPRPPDNTLPYGIWTTADGSQILFARDYIPLWIKTPDGKVSRIDPDAWVNWERQQYFPKSNLPSNKTVRKNLQRILREFIGEVSP
jgi:hypothetical protein